ncbi:MAG: transglutaminase-like domain-containing protein [Candidatus Woesearchaeota archaeon]
MKFVLAVGMLILLLAPGAFAEEISSDILNGKSASISLELSTDIRVVAEKSDYSLSILKANFSMVPKQQTNQDVTFTETEPLAEQTDDSLLFQWNDVKEGIVPVRIDAKITARRLMPEIISKITFPTTQTEEQRYTLPTKNIDSSNRQIIKVASDLAAGEDDLYKVVVKLAEWTNENVQYNLSTLTERVSQPASWVLVNRRGVCDDISVLFIAFNRALGIPARFVSGVAYTDSPLFAERWGFHGWAEVYFPGYGWVPFDVTYGEYGYVDAGHIRFMATADPAETTTRYEWKGRNVNIETSPIRISADITQIGNKFEPDVKITASPFEQEVGFGSYNAIEAEITNLRGYYAAADVLISNTEDLEIIGAGRRGVTLAPHESRGILFIVKVAEDLNARYEYTFPIIIASENTEAKTSFKAVSEGLNVPLEKLEGLQPEEAKSFNPSLKLKCSADDIYIYESANITCEATNSGNTYLERVSICADSCKYLDIGIGESRRVGFLFEAQSAGRQRIEIKATANDAASTATAEFTVLDTPKVNISGIDLPESVKFGQSFNISFVAKKASASEPRNVDIRLVAGQKEYKWLYENLEKPKNIVLGMNGNMLKEGNNEILIKLSYADWNGRNYETGARASIVLEKLNLLERIINFFLRLLG